MAEARKRGLSYGKYVALVHDGLISRPWPEDRREAPVVEEWEQQPEERLCQVCGTPIPEYYRKSRTICSPECSEELNRRRNAERYRQTRKFVPSQKIPCLKCGELFLQRRSVQKFCGRVCQENYNRAKTRARRNGGILTDMTNRNYGPGECRVCGEKYTKHSWNQEVCSRECRFELDEMKRRKGLC